MVFTGGTISMVADAAAGGKVPTLDGAAILARAPGIETIADLVPIDLGRTPASHFSFPKLFEIASEIRRWQAEPSMRPSFTELKDFFSKLCKQYSMSS